MNIYDKLGLPELHFEISEVDAKLQDIIDAIEKAYPSWRFNRTEARYESCIMAIFERRV